MLMELRKFAAFFPVLFVIFFSFFIIPIQANAAVCTQACGGSIGCTDGTSCTGGVCMPPAPSCSGGYPQSTTTTSTTGTFYSYASGVVNATSVTFPTWSSVNVSGNPAYDWSGQDDISNPWYPGADQGGGIWRATINLSTHSAGAGVINTHIYMSNCGYTNIKCGEANFQICPVAVTCPGTCHTDTQTRPNGTCGTTSCPPNAPPYQADVACTTVPISRSNGDCTTRTQAANNPPATTPPTCGPATSGPDGSCGTWSTACQTQSPQSPSITSPVAGSCLTNTPTITWSAFAATGCGGAWGYACSSPNNTFRLIDGATVATGTVIVSSLPAGITSYPIATALSHGAHTIWVCANNGQLETCSSVSIVVDSMGPGVPTHSTTLIPDTSCLGRSIVQVGWNSVSDTGCSGLNTTPYWDQISTTNFVTVVATNFDNTWVNPPVPTPDRTITSYPPGTPLQVHVRSRDSFNNQSVWSGPETIVVPSPTLYPIIHVEGPLSEDINRTCYPMSLLSDLTLEPIIEQALGVTPAVTPVCTLSIVPNVATTYSCNFTIDNQKGDCVSPNITVTMNATYSGYGTIGWRTGVGGGECTGLPTSRSYTALVGDPDTPTSETNIPIYLSYGDTVLPTAAPSVTPGGPPITPSPLPTPPFAAGWFKLKDTSFNSRMSNRQNYIPGTIQKYDTTEDDSITSHHIMIGSSGLLLQYGPVQPGSNAYVSGEVTYSANNWYTDGYTATNNITYSKYIDYIKARKDFKTITSLAEITTDGIYSISTPITLDATQFDGKKVVLVVQGTVTIDTNFIPNNGSVALLSSNIEIDPAVTEVNAILIGEQISTGNSDENALKIRGNLIDEEEGGITLGRSRSNGTKPSLFVILDPQMYIDVLPYLSTSTYDWRQIQ